MGWASGAELADNLWLDIEKCIPPIKRKQVAEAFIKNFENQDCDTMKETNLWKVAEREH